MHERKNTPCKLHTLENFAVQDILAYLDPWITFLVKVKNFNIRRETTSTEAMIPSKLPGAFFSHDHHPTLRMLSIIT